MSAEGATVRIATNEEAALGLLSEFHPWLILLDLVLSRIGELSFAKRAKARAGNREMLIVAVTTIESSEAQRVAREAGCDGYIAWPIETDTFARSVATYLEKHRSRMETRSSPSSARPHGSVPLGFEGAPGPSPISTRWPQARNLRQHPPTRGENFVETESEEPAIGPVTSPDVARLVPGVTRR